MSAHLLRTKNIIRCQVSTVPVRERIRPRNWQRPRRPRPVASLPVPLHKSVFFLVVLRYFTLIPQNYRLHPQRLLLFLPGSRLLVSLLSPPEPVGKLHAQAHGKSSSARLGLGRRSQRWRGWPSMVAPAAEEAHDSDDSGEEEERENGDSRWGVRRGNAPPHGEERERGGDEDDPILLSSLLFPAVRFFCFALLQVDGVGESQRGGGR